jgi:hypothetical protein
MAFSSPTEQSPVTTTPTPSGSPRQVSVADWIARSLVFVAMVILAFNLPNPPGAGLDASWRMALGKFFSDGLQFGRDVVFTYGPLGFLMGHTYGGLQFASLIIYQVLQAIVCSILIFRYGLRATGYSRLAFFAYFLLFGVTYEDALHQIIIAFAGFELIRHSRASWRLGTALIGVLYAVFALTKFTDCVLSAVFVFSAAGLQAWHKSWRAAGWTLGWFVGSFFIGWILCRQNPLNLPAYFHNSWVISQGYQEAMGIAPPPTALLLGLTILGLVIAYAAIYLLSAPDRPRAIATVIGLAAFTYLNWKHGFVRADGHMIGFFYCAMAVTVSFPVLLDDPPRFHLLQRCLLLPIIVLGLVGVSLSIPGVVGAFLGNTQDRFYFNCRCLFTFPAYSADFHDRLKKAEAVVDLPNTRVVIGNATIDVLGFEQAVAILNRFNYHPRPVFQSYSVYEPGLSRLNYDYYASLAAPEFVLLKLEVIDRHLATADDSEVLRLLVQRYSFVHSEGGFQLWRRKPGAFDPASVKARLLKAAAVPLGENWPASEFSHEPLWVTVDTQLSLLGRLRAFFYKPPQLMLKITDSDGVVFSYPLPPGQGRTGFIINPLVDDVVSYMRFAGGKPDRLLRALSIDVEPQDRAFLRPNANFALYAIPPSTEGRDYFREAEKLLFHMFKTVPDTYTAYAPLSENTIDAQQVMILHAPSEMVFDAPEGSKEISGSFGFLPGAYSNGGNTDGAVFSVVWTSGDTEKLLYEKALEPVTRAEDRGLHAFRISLPDAPRGRIRLRTQPGPHNNFSWDWTAWTGVDIH